MPPPQEVIAGPFPVGDYQPISNLPFLAKVVEKGIGQQLQRFLEEMDYLGLFQCGFRPQYNRESACVMLADDLW